MTANGFVVGLLSDSAAVSSKVPVNHIAQGRHHLMAGVAVAGPSVAQGR
jgi:hypothetical protein